MGFERAWRFSADNYVFRCAANAVYFVLCASIGAAALDIGSVGFIVVNLVGMLWSRLKSRIASLNI